MSAVVIEAEVDVKRPPEVVFDYCSDPIREPEWNPMMQSSTKITDDPLGVGSRYATAFRTGPPMVMECVSYERPTSWSMVAHSSALTAVGDWRVSPVPGGSHLIMRMELEPHGWLRLATPLLRRRMNPMLRRDLENIKSRLEGLEQGVPE